MGIRPPLPLLLLLYSISHVAGAVPDTDETYGAYVPAENNTLNNTNNSNSNTNSSSKSNSNSK